MELQAKLHPPTTPVDEDVEIDWKTEGLDRSNPTYYIFNKIFEKFKFPEAEVKGMPPVETLPDAR